MHFDHVPLLEMITRYGEGLRAAAPWSAACVAATLLFVFGRRLAEPLARGPVARHLLLAAVAAAGLVWAWQLRWLCDDAFITFRYAENFAHGHGLVFNIGERVEGYTDFLWAVLLALAIKLGFDVGQSSVVLSFASFVLLLWFTTRIARRFAPTTSTFTLSLAAILCAAQYTMASFATSGLETMLGALLVVVALERALAGAYLSSGLAGIGAAMTHPDHGILYVALGAALLLGPGTRKAVLPYGLPFVVVYLPYFAWRYSYYGDLFPNTYYAKSANLAYYDQGFRYIASIVIGGGFWAALPLAAYGAWVHRSSLLARFCLIGFPLFLVYIAKIGGDFMYGRLFCPLVAPLLLLAELGARELLSRERKLLALLGVLLLSVVALPVTLLHPYEKRWFVADERTFYRLKTFSPVHVDSMYFDWAMGLLKYWKPHTPYPRISMQCVGMIGFYTGWPLVDGFGLTDAVVAHTPVLKRGRPGHEKHASPAYISAQDVDISDMPVFPHPYQELTRISLDRTSYYLARFDPRVLSGIRRKPGTFIPEVSRHALEKLRKPVTPLHAEEAACDAWFAQEIYFSRSPNAPDHQLVEQHLLDAGRAPGQANTDKSLLGFRSTHVPDAASAFHFDKSERSRFAATGAAEAAFGVTQLPPPQDFVKGRTGPLVDTYLAGLEDAARVRYRSVPFKLVGDVMELSVGGGHHSEDLRVSLLVGGQRVFSSGGCGTEMMGQRLWQIAPFKGQDAVLEIVDRTSAGWGHLLVDEVFQWVAK